MLKFIAKKISSHKDILFGVFVFFVTCVVGILVLFSLNVLYPNNKLNLSQNQVEKKTDEMMTVCNAPSDGAKMACYKKEFSEATKKFGLITGEVLLVNLQNKEPLVRGCHVLGHYIGRDSYRRAPETFWDLIDIVNSNMCGTGIFHGMLEAYIGDHPEIEFNGDFANLICNRGTDEYRKFNCVHLLGHVLMLSAYGDFEEAFPKCKLVDPKWQVNCYDGLFMEDHLKLALVEHGITPAPVFDEKYIQSLVNRCLQQEGAAEIGCWMEIAEAHLHAYGYNDPVFLFKRCSQAPQEDLVDRCYSKGVTALTLQPGFETPKKIMSLCSFYEGNSRTYSKCIDNVIASSIFTSPKLVINSVTLCSNVSSEYTAMCFDLINKRLSMIVTDREARVQYCNYLPEPYRETCLK